jgi:hypothetical protein
MKRILFYEFSDCKRTPLPFHSIEDFNNFCEQNGLVSCVEGNMGIQFNSTNTNVYATCLKGTHIVVFWNCDSGPTDYFLERELRILKNFANETFSAKTTFFSDSKTMIKTSCGNNNKFYAIVWGSPCNYDYLYLTEGGEYVSDTMHKCITDDCEVIKMLQFFQDKVKKGLLMTEEKPKIIV